jgi:hypothetical protein
MLYFPHWYMGRATCDQDSLHAESVFLGDIFSQKGNGEWQILRALNPTLKISQPDNPDSVAFLPYVGLILSRISKVLSQHIKLVGPL